MVTIKLGKKMLAESEKYVRATVLGSASRIIKATPIDTGRLVGNWQSNINSPKTSKINRTNESAAQVDAKINVLKLNIGEVYYLSNNLDYAYYIEVQRGMVKTEMARLSGIFR